MATGGSYRIETEEFPAPQTGWDEQKLGGALDGFGINTSYRIHRWQWRQLDGERAIALFAAYDNQQANRAGVSIETDPYDASLSVENYGTQRYTNVVIQSISERRRGLPHYQDIEVVFEVYVP